MCQEAKGGKYYEPIYLAINIGMRRSKILGLRWKDVYETKNIKCQTVQRVNGKGIIFKDTTKTDGSRRTIAVSGSVINCLTEIKKQQNKNKLFYGCLYKDNNLILTNEDGSPMGPDALSRSFTRLIRKLNIKGVRFHDLRHSNATMLLQQGEHPKIVSERLGHATISITMDTYSHMMPNMQKEAAKKFDDFLYGKLS